MTWKEIKRAAIEAGITDEDEISQIQCEIRLGKKKFHRVKLGKTLKLAEDAREDSREVSGCAV